MNAVIPLWAGIGGSAPPPPSSRDSSLQSSRAVARLELRLYISSFSKVSLRARENLERLLAGYPLGDIALTVYDLAREFPPSVEEDRVVFTPTLVRSRPGPRIWIRGDLSDPRIFTELFFGLEDPPRTSGGSQEAS